MKNIIKFLIALISISTISCTDEVKNRDAVTEKNAPTLKSPTTLTLVLDKNNPNDAATTFVWDYAAYNGTPTVINYGIEFAAAGTNFANPTVVATTNSKYKNFSVDEINTAALNAGFTPYLASAIDVRIKATVGTTGASLPQVSNFFTMTLTPYPSWPNWSLIGSAFDSPAVDWSTDFDMTYDLTTHLYTKTIHLNAGKEFKFRLEHGWGTNFGGGAGSVTPSPLSPNGSNIPVSVTGNYKIVANFGPALKPTVDPVNYPLGFPATSYTMILQ
ncbi:MAG: SusE domain-containing protein [Flavobacterium sp.]